MVRFSTWLVRFIFLLAAVTLAMIGVPRNHSCCGKPTDDSLGRDESAMGGQIAFTAYLLVLMLLGGGILLFFSGFYFAFRVYILFLFSGIFFLIFFFFQVDVGRILGRLREFHCGGLRCFWACTHHFGCVMAWNRLVP